MEGCLGPFVHKPVNTNLGLQFNQGSCLSYSKEISKQDSKWPFESNQRQNVEQERVRAIRIIWLQT